MPQHVSGTEKDLRNLRQDNGKVVIVIPMAHFYSEQCTHAERAVKHKRFNKYVVNADFDQDGNLRVYTTFRWRQVHSRSVRLLRADLNEAIRTEMRTQFRNRKRSTARSKTGPYRRPHKGTMRGLLATPS